MSALLWPTALTLALLAGLAIFARRARGVVRKRGGERSLEVLERVSLGPKQGVAALRIADRVVVVSHGEGGIRPLAEVDDVDWSGAESAREGASIVAESEPARKDRTRFSVAVTAAERRMVAPRLRRFLLLAALATLAAIPGRAASATIAPSVIDVPALVQQAAQDSTTQAGGLLQALPPLAEDETEDGTLELNGPIGTALLIGLMALLPTLLLLATGFTRILIVLHLLKQALGAQAVPPTHLVNALALLLTLFLMTPTLDRASQEAIGPWFDGEITQAEMFERVAVPFRDFMTQYATEDDIARFVDLRGEALPPSVDDVRLTTLMAAFTTSELKRAFQLGFVLFLPFIIVDLVVASVLMSMGMFMLPPVMISLPFKLLLFVLADGWGLVVGGLMGSFI